MGDISKSEKELFEQWAKPDSVQAMVDHEGNYLDHGMRVAFTGWLARSKINQTTARVAELEAENANLRIVNRGVAKVCDDLRARVAELEAGMGEPVAWYGESDDGECHLYFDKQDMLREVLRIYTYYPLYRTPQPTKQEASEPVCWITPDGVGWRMRFEPPVNAAPLGWTPLYETPQPTKQEASEAVAWFIHDDYHGWQQCADEFNSDPDAVPLYRTPQPTPTVQAAVAAALRKAAEVIEPASPENDAFVRSCRRSILAIPNDDSALREICLKVADARTLYPLESDDFIVDRVLKGE